VVDVAGRRGHTLIDLARKVLENLQHRGAAGSDQTTGDGAGLPGDELERRLYLVRKRAERLVREGLGDPAPDFYVVSLSARTICHKGMFFAPQLFAYYPDLADERVQTALAIVHQRYGTNTFPNWRLAQPFRMTAHNGEINTIRGNRNRMRGRELRMASGLPGEDLSDLRPVLTPGGSDSCQFDNVLELLVMAGRSLPHAMMMIPEAFGPAYPISTDKRAFYEYHAAIMGPWDGPAAMVFTDGTLVGGTLDRNGLRPARYVVTTDGLVVLASETGVIDLAPRRVRSKGRLQPGRIGVQVDGQLKTGRAVRRVHEQADPLAGHLDWEILRHVEPAIARGEKVAVEMPIRNVPGSRRRTPPGRRCCRRGSAPSGRGRARPARC